MRHLLLETGWFAVAMLAVGFSLAAEAVHGTPDDDAKVSVVVRAVDGENLPGAVVYLCETAREAENPPERSETSCRLELTSADGSAVFVIEEGPRYSVTAVLEGFADTTVFPLSFGPDAEPRAPGVVVLVLNGVCFDC
jgi:hypothetical protein